VHVDLKSFGNNLSIVDIIIVLSARLRDDYNEIMLL